MMFNMKSCWIARSCAVMLLAMPTLALADDNPVLEARLLGYQNTIYTAPAATATQWLCLVGLGVVCIGVMFFNSNRSHLD
jgi:hypothetical protein